LDRRTAHNSYFLYKHNGITPTEKKNEIKVIIFFQTSDVKAPYPFSLTENIGLVSI